MSLTLCKDWLALTIYLLYYPIWMIFVVVCAAAVVAFMLLLFCCSLSSILLLDLLQDAIDDVDVFSSSSS
jgi:hypothetical protein